MASCKENCIHCNVCPYVDNGEYIDEDCLSADCPDYLNKNVVPRSEVERLRGELARANRILREIKQAHRRCNHWKLAQIIEGDEL